MTFEKMKHSHYSLGKRLTLLAITTLISLFFAGVGLEYYTRAEQRLPKSSKIARVVRVPDFQKTWTGIYALDNYLGWKTKPNLIDEVDEIHPKINTDLNGNRISKENIHINEKPKIVSFGDSFTFGSEVTDEETAPNFLSKGLEVNVLNSAVCAYGFDQMYLAVKKLLEEKEKPKLLTVSIIRDDIRRLSYNVMMYMEKPFLTLDNEGKLKYNPPKINKGLKDELNLALKRNSIFWRYYISQPIWRTARAEINLDSERIADTIIKDLGKTQKEYNVPILLVIQPTKKDSEKDINLMNLLEKKAISNGIYSLNLMNDSKEVYDNSYWKTWHMSAKGNKWVADKISDSIKLNGLEGRLQ